MYFPSESATKGYQLIEPDIIDINNFSGSGYVNASFLHWLVAALNADEEMRQLPIEFDLIIAQYVNPYPCIGACYLDPASPDLESTIIEKIGELLLRSNMLVLTRYLAENKDAIHQFNEVLRIRSEEYFASRRFPNVE